MVCSTVSNLGLFFGLLPALLEILGFLVVFEVFGVIFGVVVFTGF